MGEIPDGEPFIVPMAVPLIAGPSGMAAVMLMGSQEPGRMLEWSLALGIAWGAAAIILFYFADVWAMARMLLPKLLGRRGRALVSAVDNWIKK